MKSSIAVFGVITLAGLLTACSSPVKLDEKPAPIESRSGTTPGSGAQSSGSAVAPVQAANLGADGAAGQPQQRSVYFDFDSFVVRDDGKPVVEANAKFASTKKTQKIVIEGNTDERGGREYNLALGQKRAEAVKRSMALLGVPESQIEAVSFGKEKPRAQGSDEAAWAQNRRADIQYR
jgi:peptidoglycan-associated lipoprotein